MDSQSLHSCPFSYNMKHFILLSACIVLSCGQLSTTEGPSQIIGIPGPRWQGPFANHILGQPVGDTPEVAAAKAAHYRAHAQILEILPQLPAEELYRTISVIQPQQQHQVNIPKQSTFVLQQPSQTPEKVYVSEVQATIPPSAQTPVVLQPVQVNPQYVQFAEEIPRSELGEVPEVAAARKAHLAAYAEIEKLLPKLKETTTIVPGVQQPQIVEQQFQILDQQPHVVNQPPQVVYQQPQVVFQQPEPISQAPQVANQQVQVVQQPEIVGQQFRTLNQQPEFVNQQTQDANQQSQLWKQQLQRNLEWFYNPQQFYTYVPQDTPEVAAAKAEHLKLLQQLQ